MVTLIFPLDFLSSPHFSLTIFCVNSLQLLLSLAVVLHSPPTLSRSLLTQSSCRIIPTPPFSKTCEPGLILDLL